MEKTFEIRSYGKGELALLYNPNITASAARRKLMQWISFYPNLLSDLLKAGFTDSSKTFTPAQVRLITHALGEP